jgi:DNA-binding NarL/FixJ family response regulator
MKDLDRAGKQWTENEVSLLMHLFNLGLSDKDIAKKMKRSRVAVSTKLSSVRKAALAYSVVSKLESVEGGVSENKRRQQPVLDVDNSSTGKNGGFFGRIAKALLWWK